LLIDALVTEPEIGGEIDDLLACPAQVRHEVHCRLVRDGGEVKIGAVAQSIHVGIFAEKINPGAEAGKHLGQGLAFKLPRSHQCQAHFRVIAEQAGEFNARVAGCTDDRDFQHGKSPEMSC